MTGWLLAADRVTVKVAAAVPVLPSVTVTSPIRSRGVFWSGQAPSLSSTETVFEPAFAAATSGRPSPLKSPTATAPTDQSTQGSSDWMNVPSPRPRSTLTVFRRPVGRDDVELAVAVEVGRRDRVSKPLANAVDRAANVPSPRPGRTFTDPDPRLAAVTRSGMPSPVKSPTATAQGEPPVADGRTRSVPSPLPSSTLTVPQYSVRHDHVGLAVGVEVGDRQDGVI